jgi:alpha-tubulin suppressor-like RCC1 family protein
MMIMKDDSVQTYVYGDIQDKDLSDLAAYYESAAGAENWKNVVQITDYSPSAGRIYGLMKDGTVWESRTNTQLNTGDSKIVQICSNNAGDLLGATEDGSVKVLKYCENFERNGMHQAEMWEGMEQVVLGESHVAGLRADGTVIAVGRNYAGQCEVEEWTDIVKLAAGNTCTIGIDKEGNLFIAGALY